jgi:hypothetical protein
LHRNWHRQVERAARWQGRFRYAAARPNAGRHWPGPGGPERPPLAVRLLRGLAAVGTRPRALKARRTSCAS